MSDKELKPCPFCNEDIELIDMRAKWNKNSWRNKMELIRFVFRLASHVHYSF